MFTPAEKIKMLEWLGTRNYQGRLVNYLGVWQINRRHAVLTMLTETGLKPEYVREGLWTRSNGVINALIKDVRVPLKGHDNPFKHIIDKLIEEGEDKKENIKPYERGDHGGGGNENIIIQDDTDTKEPCMQKDCLRERLIKRRLEWKIEISKIRRIDEKEKWEFEMEDRRKRLHLEEQRFQLDSAERRARIELEKQKLQLEVDIVRMNHQEKMLKLEVESKRLDKLAYSNHVV